MAKTITIRNTDRNRAVKKGVTYVVTGKKGKSITATVSKGGYEIVKNKGTALQTAVLSGGKLIVRSGGIASNTWVLSGGRLLVSSGGIARGGGLFEEGTYGRIYSYIVNSGGTCIVCNGGRTNGLTISGIGAKQVVSSGGTASNSLLLYSSFQHVKNGGKAIGTVVSDGAQHISKGGVARNTAVQEFQIVSSGGKAVSTKVTDNGIQIISKGGIASNTTLVYASAAVFGKLYGAVVKGGESWQRSFLDVDDASGGHSGFATKVKISSGGNVFVAEGGTLTSCSIFSGGRLTADGGTFKNITLYKGGELSLFTSHYNWEKMTRLTLAQGVSYNTDYTVRYVNTIIQSGAKMTNGYFNQGNEKAQVKSGGTLLVTGGAVTAPVISKGGRLIVSSGGAVEKASILAGGSAAMEGGSFASAVIRSGAFLSMKNGTLKDASVSSGGTVKVTGGTADGFTLRAGGKMAIAGAISGTCRVYSGATLSGGTATLSGGSLSLAQGAATGKLKLAAASGAVLNAPGTGHAFAAFQTSSGARVNLDIRGCSAAGTAWAVSAASAAVHSGTFAILTKASQETGRYELARNVKLTAGAAAVVMDAAGDAGTAAYAPAKGSASAATWGGMDYTFFSSGGGLVVDVSVHNGALVIDANDTSASVNGGTQYSDIFYGGKGDDSFTGAGGRDVAVYDSGTPWGKDTVAATSGTMAIVLAGIASGTVATNLKNGTMTITRNAGESITVHGWSSATHSIVYGADVSPFLNCVRKTVGSSGAPTDKEVASAYASVWKAAGLAEA